MRVIGVITEFYILITLGMVQIVVNNVLHQSLILWLLRMVRGFWQR